MSDQLPVRLGKLLMKAYYMIPSERTECHGYKCRDSHCASCYSEEDVEQHLENVRQFRIEIIDAVKEI